MSSCHPVLLYSLAHRYLDPPNGTKTLTNLRTEMIEPNDTPSTLHYIRDKENHDPHICSPAQLNRQLGRSTQRTTQASPIVEGPSYTPIPYPREAIPGNDIHSP